MFWPVPELLICLARILKAKKSKDPDLPSLHESLTGPHSEQFWEAVDKEIASLEGKGTWEVVDRKDVPAGIRVIPGTWCQRIKRHPDGRLTSSRAAGASEVIWKEPLVKEIPTPHWLDGPPFGPHCCWLTPKDGNPDKLISPWLSVKVPKRDQSTWNSPNTTDPKALVIEMWC